MGWMLVGFPRNFNPASRFTLVLRIILDGVLSCHPRQRHSLNPYHLSPCEGARSLLAAWLPHAFPPRQASNTTAGARSRTNPNPVACAEARSTTGVANPWLCGGFERRCSDCPQWHARHLDAVVGRVSQGSAGSGQCRSPSARDASRQSDAWCACTLARYYAPLRR